MRDFSNLCHVNGEVIWNTNIFAYFLKEIKHDQGYVIVA